MKKVTFRRREVEPRGYAALVDGELVTLCATGVWHLWPALREADNFELRAVKHRGAHTDYCGYHLYEDALWRETTPTQQGVLHRLAAQGYCWLEAWV